MADITLRVIDGADRGRVYERRTPITIGREEGNGIQLNDDRISRFHVKIQEDQEHVVLTDLDSTNGTKVNGEETQLRILRHGDMVTLGRSVLLVGTRDQIEDRLRSMAGAEASQRTMDPSDQSDSLDFELGVPASPSSAQASRKSTEPPSLPASLSPGQAAQLTEMLEFFHVRIRQLLVSVESDPANQVQGSLPRVSLDYAEWQALVDVQARIADYLRSISEPHAGT
jgi:pSer/pThr/pTyr-binding forkhead associated (FHA) protein